jgi:hypothetical protein
MGDWIFATVAVAALVIFAPQAEAGPRKAQAIHAPAARSAEAYAVQASYRGALEEKGYSRQARRVADCLATYPGAYDPKTDRVRVGVQTRRCDL